MRIISGKFKGKKILEPKDRSTRPLKDLTKESIFNIIQHSNLINVSLAKSNILDLFCGIGSFGLESLSRGALSITFVENYLEAIQILKRNIANLDFNEKSIIFEKDVFENNFFEELNKKFQIVFIDCPYKEKRIYQLLENINKSNILDTNNILIIHRHKKEVNDFPKEVDILKEVSYGVSKIIFFRFV